MRDETADPIQYSSGVTPEVAELIRHIGIVGIVGVTLGVLVGGVGGRVVMRVAGAGAPDQVQGSLTENGNAIGDITVGGTIEILIFVGILFGGVGAAAYVMSERWLRWTGAFRPIAFGLLLFVVGSPGTIDPENLDFLLVGNHELVVAMFVALFLLYGIPLPLLVGALEERLPGVNPARPLESVVGYLALIGISTMFAALLVVVALESGSRRSVYAHHGSRDDLVLAGGALGSTS